MRILVDTEAKAEKLRNALANEPVLGFDTESSGPRLLKKDMINVHRSELTGFSVASPSGTSWYVPVRHARGNLSTHACRSLLETAVSRDIPGFRTWVHNLKHEYHVLRREGVIGKVPTDGPSLPFLCSQLARWWQDLPSSYTKKPYSLKSFMRDWGWEVRDFTEVSRGRDWRDVPPNEPGAVDYACLDAEASLKLGEESYNGLGKGYFEVEVPLAEVLADIESRGMYVNTEALSALHREAEEQLARIEEEWFFTWPGVSISSAHQVRRHFFGEGLWPVEGVELTPKRKEPKCDDEAMRVVLANPHTGPEGRRAAELRVLWGDWDKVRSTYTESLVLSAGQHLDNRLRPNFRGDGTHTGRLSCEVPNLQNIPIRSELGKRIKRCFEAPEGKLILAADYSQIELRVLAHFAKRGRLFDGYLNGADVHAETGQLMSLTRDGGKKFNFSRVYRAGPWKLAKDMRISEERAAEYLKLHEKLYPECVEVTNGFIQYAREHGYIRSIGGKIRRLSNIHSPVRKLRGADERKAGNNAIQGSAGYIVKLGMLSAFREGIQMTGQVHDEVVGEVYVGQEKKMQSILDNALSNAYPSLRVPLVVESKVAKNWQEAK